MFAYKILRNELDDGFYTVMKLMSRDLAKLIQQSEGTLLCKAKSFKNGQEEEFLPLSAAKRVCESSLQNYKEVKEDVIRKLEFKANKTEKKTASIRKDEDLVRITDLEAVILSFKVLFHHQFLFQVRRSFKRFEQADSGFISFDKLDQFLDSLDAGLVNPEKPVFREMMGKGWKFISFSHVVQTLSESLVIDHGEYKTVLEKLYLKFTGERK